MPEEKIADGGAAQTPPPAKTEVADVIATPAKEESVDEKVQEILGDIPTVPEKETEKPEETPAATPPEKEGEIPEKKIEDPAEVNQPESPEEKAPQPSRIDRRIAKLYLSNLLLKGHEGEIPDTEAVIQAIKDYPLAEKTKALQNLLSEQRMLRTGKDDGTVDLSEEDHQAIVDAEVENRLNAIQGEIQKKEWNDDLVKTVEAHPELDERKNEYNPKIAIAVEKLAQNGMKVSDAYSLVTDSISTAKVDEKKEEEIKKQKALSGAVSASNENVEPKGDLTWEDLAKMQVEDPDRYIKLVKEGKLPKE